MRYRQKVDPRTTAVTFQIIDGVGDEAFCGRAAAVIDPPVWWLCGRLFITLDLNVAVPPWRGWPELYRTRYEEALAHWEEFMSHTYLGQRGISLLRRFE